MKTKIIPCGPCGPRGSTLWRALVVPAATVIAATTLGTAAQSAPRGAIPVTGNIVFQMMDHEDFAKNERCRHDNAVVNNLGTPGAGSWWYFGKCGGEVRGEFHYQLLRNSDGTVEMRNAKAYLYEGTSADTRDLDGELPFFWDVLGQSPWKIPKGQTSTKTFHVDNAMEREPDDKADITLTLTNH